MCIVVHLDLFNYATVALFLEIKWLMEWWQAEGEKYLKKTWLCLDLSLVNFA
jgi:hypothetical protein